MMNNYKVSYSGEALSDLRAIYSYIAYELLVPKTGAAQIKRIREKILSLDFMSACHELVGWEPWQSMNMHQLPIDNYIAYYLVDDKTKMVIITRIFYGCRDIKGIINSNI